MGHYAYLEHLDTLGDILARDLEETRSRYAERSELDVQLRAGVKLVDAAGYPIEPVQQAKNRFRIKTGAPKSAVRGGDFLPGMRFQRSLLPPWIPLNTAAHFPAP
jgi:hypothetical protein